MGGDQRAGDGMKDRARQSGNGGPEQQQIILAGDSDQHNRNRVAQQTDAEEHLAIKPVGQNPGAI